MRKVVFVAASLVSMSVVAAACSSGTPQKQAGKISTAGTEAPLPAGKNPSKISQMVCGDEAQEKIATVLGVTARVSTPTWINHLYSCDYEYPNGSFVMSVKEVSSWSQTLGWFHSLGKSLGDTGSLGNLGQGAFTTSNGSVVVRKDWKILTVQISGLPAQFGKPATSRAAVAYTVADLILGCWDGD
jgi:hypothetical protein